MNIREDIKDVLLNKVLHYANVATCTEYDLPLTDRGIIMSVRECDLFAAAAIRELKDENLINPCDINVIMWKNDHTLLHTGLCIYGYFFDSIFLSGKLATREFLNTIFAKYMYSNKAHHIEENGVLLEDITNKILFNPWPREDIIYTYFTEYIINGKDYFKEEFFNKYNIKNAEYVYNEDNI